MTRLLLLGSARVSATALAAQPASCPQPQMQLEPLISWTQLIVKDRAGAPNPPG